MLSSISKKHLLIIFLIAFFSGFIINELNLLYINKNNPHNVPINGGSTLYGYTILNADNHWYLPPIKYILNGDGYTLDPKNPEMKVRRTPGYALFYGLHYVVFGEKYSFLAIRYTQLLIFACSAVLLCLLVFHFTLDKQWAFCTGIAYALCIFVSVYAYYTITESLSPACIILAIFFFSIAYKKQQYKFFIITGILIAISTLVRPLLGILFPACFFCIFFLKDIRFPRKVFFTIFLSIGLIIGLAPWIIRNYLVTQQEFIPLEKFYNNDPMGYGKGYVALRNWINCWANPAANFLADNFSTKLKANIAEGNPNNILIDRFINSLPNYAFAGYSRGEIKQELLRFNDCVTYQSKVLPSNVIICEEDLAEKFNYFRAIFKKKNFLRYYLTTPLIIIKDANIHSNSHAFASLNMLDGKLKFWQKCIKSIMYLLNIVLFISFILFYFTLKNHKALNMLVYFIVLAHLFLFAYIIRYLEVRYILPLYPIYYICLGYFLSKSSKRFSLK